MPVATAADDVSVGTYSDMGYNDESGDVNGQEIQVLMVAGDYYVIHQCRMEPPVLIPAKVAGNRISFSSADDGGTCFGEFEGQITKAGLCLWIAGDEKHAELLPRMESYWVKRVRLVQKTKNCMPVKD